MPFVIPPLVKWALAAMGGAAVVSWAVKEIRASTRSSNA